MTSRRRPQLSLYGFFLLFGISMACASPPSEIPLKVEYAGCRAVLSPGTICVLPPSRSLSLWVGAPPQAQIEIRADASRMDTAGEIVQNGQWFSLTIPPEAQRINVLVENGAGQASWFLSLADQEAQGDRVRQANQDLLGQVAQKMLLVHSSIQNYQLAAARETLNALRLPTGAPAESHIVVMYYRGLLAEKEGDYRSALADVQKAAELAQRLKLDLHLWIAEEQLALLLRGVGRSREAAELFDRLRRLPHSADSCQTAQLLANQAWATLLAREAGERLGAPTQLLEKALETYQACPDFTPGKRVNILINLALSHLQEGDLPRAKAVLAEAREIEPEPSLAHTLWWLDLEARIALREQKPADALRLFERLEELAQGASSPNGALRAVFGQARSQKSLGNESAALETLRKAEVLLDEQSLQVPIHEGRETFMATRQTIVSLHVEILLDQGRSAEALDVARHSRSRMLRQLERSDRLANLSPDRRARWERLLSNYQERRAALEERAQADRRLPAGQLRREQATRQAEMESLKELLDRAFLVLDDAAEPQGETLPPPRAGELLLTWCPLSQGWVGFAADGHTITTYRFGLPSGALRRPGELSRRLLLPFRAEIEKAKRIRILPAGPLQGVDFHALPFEGDVLLARHPIVYGLDLPVPSGPAHPAGRHALLVADPRDDLAGARSEAYTVRKVLEAGSRPWTTEELRSAKASAEVVRRRLAAADLLHYTGHSTYSGFGGWDSSLLLAGATRLTLGDLLALDRVPAWVVLSGCDTGRTSIETPVESLGLAHAFLLAGSQAVIASVRPADDLTIPAFFTGLYQQLDREADPSVAFQRAQLAWREQNPKADWAGFRLFVP
jgi:cellulose synthase operon protein C